MMVGKQLMEIRRYDVAADMFTGVGKYEEAVRCYLEVKDFQKAKSLCASIKQGELAVRLANMVDKAQRDQISSSGNAMDLVEVDAKERITC